VGVSYFVPSAKCPMTLVFQGQNSIEGEVESVFGLCSRQKISVLFGCQCFWQGGMMCCFRVS